MISCGLIPRDRKVFSSACLDCRERFSSSQPILWMIATYPISRAIASARYWLALSLATRSGTVIWEPLYLEPGYLRLRPRTADCRETSRLLRSSRKAMPSTINMKETHAP